MHLLSLHCYSKRLHFYLLFLIVFNNYTNAGYLTDKDDIDQQNLSNDGDDTYDIYSCCKFVYGSCKSACENLSLVHLASNVNGKHFKLIELKRLCPISEQAGFWKCMNRTLSAVTRGAEWSGRQCCLLAVTPRCQNTCATSSQRQELSRGCRQSDEQSLYSCFERQETGDECCGSARTSECLQACRAIFQGQQTATRQQRDHVERVCNDNNTNMKVLHCIKQFIDLTPINNSKQYLPCCEFSQSSLCQVTCKHNLETGENMQEIIDSIEKNGCGPPLPHDPMWQCFLSADQRVIHPSSTGTELISKINQLGMDSAKLHCCHKALAPKCGRLCTQTFSSEWTETRRDFEIDCYNKINEISLRTCLDEVEEPCELGCDGLSFCSNFNNRPTELFRSCNAQADYAARADIELWKANRSLSLPGLSLPIYDVSKCEPEAWQAISCILQTKPCSRSKHATQICQEDCYDILSKCMDWTRLETRHTPESICSKFALKETADHPCISLKPYLEPSDLPRQHGLKNNHKVVSPCRGHTCNNSEVCVLASKEEIMKGSSDYQCIPGCPLGETSSFLVPFGSYARIPISAKPRGCFKVCRCSKNGRLESCHSLPCISYDSCNLADRKIEHGTWFPVECNICSCFAGEISCTKRQCRIPGISDQSYTSLPCNCPPHFVPVCGRNGQTYPSACVSKCAGLKDADIEFGACRSKDPCKDVDCPAYAECVENRHICLSVMHKPCKQYQCVNITSNCPAHDKGACSSDNRSFSSICHLLKAKSTLSYRGRCMDGCRRTPVCGINGISYRNECEAWSDYSVADYDGACREIGLLTKSLGQRCASVKCSKSTANCPEGLITPPGACCPICGGAIRILYSRKQIDRALFVLQSKSIELLTLQGILRSLEGLIRLANCRLSGYLTIELEIFIIVQSTEHDATSIQHEACIREAEKIATLIDTQSHRITSDIALSSLTVAHFIAHRDDDGHFSGTTSTQFAYGVIFSPVIAVLLQQIFI